jgi:hypothetical protein
MVTNLYYVKFASQITSQQWFVCNKLPRTLVENNENNSGGPVMERKNTIRIQVAVDDVLEFDADVLVLKYAQQLYGADWAVYNGLNADQILLPETGEFKLCKTGDHEAEHGIAAHFVLFVGVKPLGQFGYAEIREFARRALIHLAKEAPTTRHIALTLHGPGYGLDEKEAFESELAGLVDAVTTNEYPAALETISFVEKNEERARRLIVLLRQLLPDGLDLMRGQKSLSSLEHQAQATLRSAGYSSASKPHVFVAMPFVEVMDDIFHYGIQRAVNAAGLLCERVDTAEAFTGDILERIKGRIKTATLVIADLTAANPNVYLEVGYAWGCSVPTVLLVKDAAELKFDVRGQRCVIYKSIRQLEEALGKELQGLTKH